MFGTTAAVSALSVLAFFDISANSSTEIRKSMPSSGIRIDASADQTVYNEQISHRPLGAVGN